MKNVPHQLRPFKRFHFTRLNVRLQKNYLSANCAKKETCFIFFSKKLKRQSQLVWLLLFHSFAFSSCATEKYKRNKICWHSWLVMQSNKKSNKGPNLEWLWHPLSLRQKKEKTNIILCINETTQTTQIGNKHVAKK